MDKNHYLNVGFKFVGYMYKSETVKKKHKVAVEWLETFDPTEKMGVYIICSDDKVLKIGESQNLRHRFSCYESHSGQTNKMVRENMEKNHMYPLLFLECPSYIVGFGGVEFPSGINYRILEKNLIKQYIAENEELPIWNKGIQ